MLIRIKDHEYGIDFRHESPDIERIIEKSVSINKFGGKTIYIEKYIPKRESYGKTECDITLHRTPIFHGEAKCYKGDVFNKSIGRKEALKKALDNSTFSKNERIEFWKQYNNRKS